MLGNLFTMSIRRTSYRRIAIHPKDVEVLTGKGLRASQKMLEAIKKELGRKKHQMITVTEFCTYVGFDETLVRDTIF